MVFHRTLLQEFPWTSHSCAEDTEYTIELTRNGQRIRFLSNAYIRCQGVESLEALRVQRTRWARGNIDTGHGQAFRLIVEGLRRRKLRTVDLGWTLLLISRPLVLAHLCGTLLAALLSWSANPTPTTAILAALTCSLLPLYAVYFGVGVLATGVNATRLNHLFRSPAIVFQLGKIAISALVGMGTSSWVRTPRQ